jgi:hypothetical protein
MATKPTKTSTVKAKSTKAAEKTTAPKVSRARKSDVVSGVVQTMRSGDIRTPGRDEIAARAYARFAARGFQHGSDVEDWLAAERELTQH